MKDVDYYLSSVAYDRYLKPRHRSEQIGIRFDQLFSREKCERFNGFGLRDLDCDGSAKLISEVDYGQKGL